MGRSEIIIAHLPSPIVRAFGPGLLATLVKSDLEFPRHSATPSNYLLRDRLEGGIALAARPLAAMLGPWRRSVCRASSAVARLPGAPAQRGAAPSSAPLAGSASYSAAPAACAAPLPQANPAFYATAALGLTFAFISVLARGVVMSELIELNNITR